jgi:hypothetical protein
MAGLCALLVPASARAQAVQGNSIVGTWLCSVVRPGSVAKRPIIYQFGADGLFSFASGTNINALTGNPPNFYSRSGGGRGQWTRTPGGSYVSKQFEILLNQNGNLGGYFNVESTYQLLPNGQLCSGATDASGNELCPGTVTNLAYAAYTFNSDGTIAGQTAILPPGTHAKVLCNSMDSGPLAFPDLPSILQATPQP